jgi:hypothetical protein
MIVYLCIGMVGEGEWVAICERYNRCPKWHQKCKNSTYFSPWANERLILVCHKYQHCNCNYCCVHDHIPCVCCHPIGNSASSTHNLQNPLKNSKFFRSSNKMNQDSHDKTAWHILKDNLYPKRNSKEKS